MYTNFNDPSTGPRPKEISRKFLYGRSDFQRCASSTMFFCGYASSVFVTLAKLVVQAVRSVAGAEDAFIFTATESRRMSSQ